MINKPAVAVALLEEFISYLRVMAHNQGPSFIDARDSAAQRLSMVLRIIEAADPSIPVDWAERPVYEKTFRLPAEQAANRAIGAINYESTIVMLLAPEGPKLAAQGLHEAVWSPAQHLWASGNFSSAVQRGATGAVQYIRDLVEMYDGQDSDLMNQAFSTDPPNESRARLRWPGRDDDQTVKSMRNGLRSLALGLIGTVRNPSTHTTEEMTESVALEQLAALSMFIRMVERCEKVPMTG